MLSVVKRLMTSKGDDVAALQEEIAALKRQGAQACAEIEEIEQRRALAPSYEAALAGEDRCKQLRWQVDHCAALLPELEARLAAARAIDQAAALKRHRAIIGAFFPRLRAALIEAGRIQAEAIKARQTAAAEVGEHAVALNIPFLGYRGLVDDSLISAWCAEQERVWSQPAPSRPRPVRAALPAPTKSKPPVAVAKEPATRPKRVVRHDFPTEGQALVVFLRGGVDLEDGSVAAIGDQIALPAEQARQLVLRGAADFVPAPATEEPAHG
jgi:hypothetical protein